MTNPNTWTLLIYRIPAQPTRLRLAIWRRLQKMGVVYLQDAVCLLPDRPDLTENMTYVAATIEEMGGTCHLFAASTLLPGGDDGITALFRAQFDAQLDEIVTRLDTVQQTLLAADQPEDIERAEEELKRERIAYLRARKFAFFGGSPEREAAVEDRLDRLKKALDDQYRGGGK
jgi:hypothetical protein